MNYYKMITSFIILFSNSSLSYAATESFELGNPTFFGNACPSGTVHFVLSPDENTLSVLFDQYRVEAGNGTPFETKFCEATIPIKIPENKFLQILEVDYRGFNSLPSGGKSSFITHYRFQGGTEKKEKRDKPFKGPLNSDFIDTDREWIRSPCTQTVVLDIHTRLNVWSNNKQDQAFTTIDSSDMSPERLDPKNKRKIHYKMSLKKCNEGHFATNSH